MLSVFTTFRRDESGAVAIIFALMSVVLFTAMGLAVDYARNESVRSEVQSALDDALLSAAAQSRRQDANPISLAQKFFNENWTRKYKDTPVEIKFVKGDNGSLSGSAVVSTPTTLAQVAGVSKMKASLSSSVQLGEGSVELVLALDTTGSMAGEKLDTLKSSATELVETLHDVSGDTDRIKIGLVPFARYVNVGLDNRNASWMSVPADSSVTEETCSTTRPVTGSSNCRTETGTGTNDGVPYTYTYETCDYEYGEEQEVCQPNTTNTTWHGCAGSRNHPLNVEDRTYTTTVPGIMNVTCSTPVVSLTSDEGTVTDALDGLTASGETYVPAGLTWAWRVLSPDAPYTGGSAYGAKKDGIPVRKILVLMTDGNNTRSPTYPSHDGGDQMISDALTNELCGNVKETGIEVFTVAFEVDDDDTRTMLKTCATSTKHFFNANSAEELRTAFVNIAKDATPLRLVK